MFEKWGEKFKGGKETKAEYVSEFLGDEITYIRHIQEASVSFGYYKETGKQG